MSFRLLLLAAVAFVTSNGKCDHFCEYKQLHKCDEEFVAGFEAHPNDPDMEVYCNVFQVCTDLRINNRSSKRLI